MCGWPCIVIQYGIRKQLDVTLCYPLFLLYKLLNMFRATICPSSGADDCVVLSPLVGIVLWLQEGCQNRLAFSVSIEEFVLRQPSCSHGTIPTSGDNTTQSSAPEDGHMVARNTLCYELLDTLPANRFWQPSCSHSTIPTSGDNTTQSSAPEDGHMVARNMLSNL